MNSDTNMATGQYTFGDLDSNSTIVIDFKTMPIRRHNRFALGEPTFLYEVKATLNHNGKVSELTLVDKEESLRRHRPFLIF
jgi:hypothetical protein